MRPDAAVVAAADAAARSALRASEALAAIAEAQRRLGVSAEAAAAALAGNSVLHATVSKDYLSRVDAEEVVAKVANGELEVPRNGERIYVGLESGLGPLGPHPELVVYRDQGRRTINVALPKGKVLARIAGPVCRWCAGLGLHPFLPDRTRQIFTMERSVELEPQRNITELGHRHLISSVAPGRYEVRKGVDVNWPLVRWWLHASDLHEALPPFEELTCPRCLGEGF